MPSTLHDSNTAAAPAINTVLAVITAPPPGVYRVKAILSLTGTTETQLQNLRLRSNAVAVGDVLPTLSAKDLELEWDAVVVPAGNIDLQVVASATAGSVYNTQLFAYQVA